MSLSETQRTTLAAHIRANTDQDVIDALAVRNDSELTRLYSLDSSFIVWRLAIPASDVGKTVIYNALSALTTANTSRVQLFMDLNSKSFDGSADIEAYFDDTFSGALNGSGADCRAALSAMQRRAASVAESIYATGTGNTSTPGTLVFQGTISTDDVGRALNDNP